jgi:hypothetical protein
MNSTNNLNSELSQFIGTEKFYRITPRHLLTDGTNYLAEKAHSFWLMDAIASHLPKYFHDYFCVANLKVNGTRAVLTIDDGNGNVYAKQNIEYRGCTEFCVNGLMAGNRRISRSGYDLKHKESSTQRSH